MTVVQEYTLVFALGIIFLGLASSSPSSWPRAFVPMWLMDGFLLLFSIGSFKENWLKIFLICVKVIFEGLLVARLSETTSHSYITVCIPLLILLATIVVHFIHSFRTLLQSSAGAYRD